MAIFLTYSRNLAIPTRSKGPDWLKRCVIRERAVAGGKPLSFFFVSVTPGSPSRVTTHSVLEWAALIITIRPTRAGFHASFTFAKSPGLHRSPLTLVSRSTLTPHLPAQHTVYMYSSLASELGNLQLQRLMERYATSFAQCKVGSRKAIILTIHAQLACTYEQLCRRSVPIRGGSKRETTK